MKNKYFYERNDRFLNNYETNVFFEDILKMTPDQFRAWLRKTIDNLVECWDKYGTPPVVGVNEAEIVDQFNEMVGFNSDLLWAVDEDTGEKNVIRNKYFYGSAVNQWFPTMYKAPIKTSTKKDGESIYDALVDPDKFESFYKSAWRNFKHDSFYHYSQSIKKKDKSRDGFTQPLTDDPFQWVEDFYASYIWRESNEYDFWLNPIKSKEYTGYKKELFDAEYLWLTKDQLIALANGKSGFDIVRHLTYADDWNVSDLFEIRFYKKKQRMFPLGMKVFRIAYGKQIAVNFPPLIAKALYEKYTDHIDKSQIIHIYDPSAGWGGRILGAMSVRDDRRIHYIGTDPNTDHNTSPGRTKYHEVADFFNARTTRANPLFSHQNTYTIYQLGSEVIKDNGDFQKYKRKIDLVFTSPPYFAKEVYSDDPEQSCHKFGTSYEAWRDGFLKPTLETAVQWLADDRYLLWNIADVEFDGVRLPLEQDSRDILEKLGMIYVETIKMALAQMPGANRLIDTGDYEEYEENTLDGVVKKKEKVFKMHTKNFCQVNGKMIKYEPIFVFKKPRIDERS